MMNEEDVEQLKQYIGRKAVYIESGQMCLATLADVDIVEDRLLRVSFSFDQVASCACTLRIFRQAGEDQVKSWSSESPFGSAWSCAGLPKEFYLDPEYLQACFLYGGGVRVFFQPEYIERFLRHDLDWLSEYYGDDEDAEEE